MKKIEYKAVTITAAPGITKKGIAKFDANITEQLNKISADIGKDGWELTTIFAVTLEAAYSAVFKREVNVE